MFAIKIFQTALKTAKAEKSFSKLKEIHPQHLGFFSLHTQSWDPLELHYKENPRIFIDFIVHFPSFKNYFRGLLRTLLFHHHFLYSSRRIPF